MKSLSKVVLVITLLCISAACVRTPPPPPPPPPPVEDPVEDAISFYNRGNYDQAKEILVEEMRYNSQDPRVYYYLGNIYMIYQDCTSALPMYEQALMLDPGYYEARRKLDEATMICAPPPPTTKKKAKKKKKKPIIKKKFDGGAKALDPADF